MKKHILSLILLVTIMFRVVSQTPNKSSVVIDSKEYESLKKQGKLSKDISLVSPQSFTPTLNDLKSLGVTHQMQSGGSACSCYIVPDNTYSLAMPRNDDNSGPLLNIPFNFCLYGTTYNSLYINNNGNVSFDSPYSTFSSNPFPDPSFVMVAPFWGDVDTRGLNGGYVWYKITPTAMYVNWEAVGWYDETYSPHTPLFNTFQLIITDGNDPILPSGNNIAFCYGDMQWTTGDASGGTDGFGGTNVGASPATVGVNWAELEPEVASVVPPLL